MMVKLVAMDVNGDCSQDRRIRWLLWLALASVGVIAVIRLAPHLDMDTSTSAVFDQSVGDELAEVSQQFGTDDVLMIVLQDHQDVEQPIFNPTARAYQREINRCLSDSGIVEAVVSLETLEEVKVRKVLGQYVPGLPGHLLGKTVGPSRIRQLRRDPFLARGMLSEDGRSVVTYGLIHRELRTEADYLEKVRALVASLPSPSLGFELSVTGLPVIEDAIVSGMARDGVVLTLLAMALVAFIAWGGGVSLQTVLAYVVAWPIVAAFLVMWFWLSRRPIHGFLPSLLPLLVITSGSTLIHLGLAPRTHAAWREVLKACAVSTTATALGFSCLGFSPIPALAALGIEAIVGTVIAFVVTGTAVGWVAWSAPSARRMRLIQWRVASRWPKRLAVVLLIATALPWWLIDANRLSRQGAITDALPRDHAAIEATDILESAAGSMTTVDFVLRWKDDAGPELIQTPEFYLALQSFEQALTLDAQDDLGFILGPTALIAYLNTRLIDDDDAEPGAHFEVTEESAAFAVRWLIRPYLAWFGAKAASSDPDSQLTVGRNLLGTLRDRMRPFLSADGKAVRLMGRVQALPPERMLELKQAWETRVFPKYRERLGSPSLAVTGYAMAMARTTVSVRAAQLQAIGLGGILLAILLVLILRSLKAGLVAIVASAGALFSTTSVIWICNLNLSYYSTVLFATALGVLADDAIHLMLARRTRGGDIDCAVRTAGPRVILTSIGLAVGFAAFAGSGLLAYRDFAIAGVAAVTLALGWDLLLLPYLAKRWL